MVRKPTVGPSTSAPAVEPTIGRTSYAVRGLRPPSTALTVAGSPAALAGCVRCDRADPAGPWARLPGSARPHVRRRASTLALVDDGVTSTPSTSGWRRASFASLRPPAYPSDHATIGTPPTPASAGADADVPPVSF